jgi:hypothetical protein
MKKALFFPVFLCLLMFWNQVPVFSQATITCNPDFDSGCSNWRTKSISIAGFSWSQATSTNCAQGNFTQDTIFLVPGVGYSMTIQNGSWCGTGVWVDLNNDNSLDTSENLYYKYLANENNTYQFTLTLPDSLPLGAYAIRVVSGWGTDCFSESENGFGPCGIYTYGNYQDFILKATTVTSQKPKQQQEDRRIRAFKTTGDLLKIELPETLEAGQEVRIYDLQGNVVRRLTGQGLQWEIPLNHLSHGLYWIGIQGKPAMMPAVFRN